MNHCPLDIPVMLRKMHLHGLLYQMSDSDVFIQGSLKHMKKLKEKLIQSMEKYWNVEV